MNISPYLDEYLMPPELFQRFLIPLSYKETLAHCQAYYHKTKNLVCSKDFWLKKIEKVPIKDRQELFNQAVRNGYTLLIQPLLEDENVDPAANKNNAIRWASQNGYADIVKLLLADQRVDPAVFGNEAIRQAAMDGHGHVDVVKALTQLTGLVDKRVDPSDKNNHAIKLAAMHGYADVVQLLLADKRVDPSDEDNSSITYAAKYGYTDVVKALTQLTGLADKRVESSADYDKVIRVSAEKGHVNVAKLIFYWYASYSELDKIFSYVRNYMNLSKISLSIALKFACYHQNYENVKLLLKMGADRRVQSNYCEKISLARNDKKMLRLLAN